MNPDILYSIYQTSLGVVRLNFLSITRLTLSSPLYDWLKRYMKEMNLLNNHKKRFRKIVPRTMVVSRPNTFWETDFTNVYIDREGWAYFTAYPDLCSRKIK